MKCNTTPIKYLQNTCNKSYFMTYQIPCENHESKSTFFVLVNNFHTKNAFLYFVISFFLTLCGSDWGNSKMGNALRLLCGQCIEDTTTGDYELLGHHCVSAATVGLSALAHDLFLFEITSQVYIYIYSTFLATIIQDCFYFSSNKWEGCSNFKTQVLPRELDNIFLSRVVLFSWNL